MIVFQDLRITPDGKSLCIDAIIAPYDYQEGDYITSIIIDTEETFNPAGPSSTPVFKQEFTEQNKQQSLILDANAFGWNDFSNHILYVYVSMDNSLVSDDKDSGYNLGITLWWYPIYNIGINYMQKVVDNCCGMPKEFIDYILRFNAFNLALRTANYPLANQRFKQWFVNIKSKYITPCSC